VKGTVDDTPYAAPPDVERIGDGMFLMSHPPHEAGRRRKLVRR
jgi:hypothetical protein